MVVSMTAFTRKMQAMPFGALTWEVRTVNHRFLEMSVRLPEAFRRLEKLVRDRIQQTVLRGKLEATLKFHPGEELPFDLVVNTPLLEQLAMATESVVGLFPGAVVNPIDILKWQGVLETQQRNTEQIDSAVLELLELSLCELMAMRQREGDGIRTFMMQRLADIEKYLAVIEERLPVVKKQAEVKLLAKFGELSAELDQSKLEQELLWVVQKSDVAEEMQRLSAHLIEVRRVLNGGGAIGRRLDFLMQELNREANTLGSKSIDAPITQVVVELKVQIEQMREQVQNIE